MPSKIIFNENKLKVFQNYIKSGKTAIELKHIFGISRNVVIRIAKENRLKEKLYENNKNKQDIIKSNFTKLCKNKIYLKFNLVEKYYNEIYNCINSGGILLDVLKVTNFEFHPSTIVKYLNYKNLNKKRLKNSSINKKIIAVQNGRLSSNTLKGIQLKPITPEISDFFKECLKQGKYYVEIRKELKCRFNFSEKKYIQLCNLYGKPDRNPQTGNLNPMYGKSPGPKAGIGAKGWLIFNGKKIFFRSSLELKVYLYLIENDIKFQISRHRIHYLDEDNIERTYNPDIIIGTTICEVKPEKLKNTELNIRKNNALKKYCNQFSLLNTIITENTYDIKNILSEQKINELIDKKNLIFVSEADKNKVIKYLGA